MGLDMFMHGLLKKPDDDLSIQVVEEDSRLENEYQGKYMIPEIAYWRKHPDLHGLIVELYANGEDKCQPIYLSYDDLQHILNMVLLDELPKTEGFFFGASSALDRDPTITALEEVMDFYKTHSEEDPEVFYQASW